MQNESNEGQTKKKEWVKPEMEILVIEGGPVFGSEASPGNPNLS
jgi:hypothetical protein